MLSNFTNQEIK